MEKELRYKVIEGDNFGRDYPLENLVLPDNLSKSEAEALCDKMNSNHSYDRWHRIVSQDYTLSAGFEP